MTAFTIRVYAIIEENGKILLSRERIQDKVYVKFPGGGLEYGEGTRDCLKRELIEELGLTSEVKDHFYTTDFFQPSVFHKSKMQVLSIYYRVVLVGAGRLETIEARSAQPGFFWVAKSALSTDLVDLPIDRKVMALLKQQ